MEREKPIEGQEVIVQVYNPLSRECDWLAGVCNGTISAMDRPYRVNVTLNSGAYISAAAPECIKIKS